MEELNKYSYKTLNVYQDAKKFVVDVYKLLKLFRQRKDMLYVIKFVVQRYL
jgi:hypothetical protein